MVKRDFGNKKKKKLYIIYIIVKRFYLIISIQNKTNLAFKILPIKQWHN